MFSSTMHYNSTIAIPARADILLQEPSQIELAMPLTSAKLSIGQLFFRYAKLYCTNEKSLLIARPTWPKMRGRCTNQLLKFVRKVISITAHCVMGRHAERLQVPSNDFYYQ